MSTGAHTPTRQPAPRVALPRARHRPEPAVLWLVAVLALGSVARLRSPSELWLDEALSVAIARRPVPDLLAALRQDGSPPLYYLLLHGWSAVFGVSDTAVRALSTVFSLATLPFAYYAGRRLGGPLVARSTLLLLAVSPFAVRYATEARMYALAQLLGAAGLLALLRALERPSVSRLLPVSLCAGLLALTHYWALFLLATTAALLVLLAVRGPARTPPLRALAAMVCGGVLFAPWLPTFAFQVTRTGTPWAVQPKLVDAWYTLTGWAGGGEGPAVALTLVLAALVVLAVCGRAEASTVVLGRPLDRTGLLLLAGTFGTLLLGLVTGMVLSAGYVPRYSSVALVPGLLLAGLGVRALPPRLGTAALALAAVCGLLGALPQLTSTRRTQAGVTAAALRAGLAPGDVVAYCPDQLGPAVSRLLPPGTDQVVYPGFGSPELVDWVDYARRNAAASPAAFAGRLSARTRGALWLVSAGGYRTYGTQCEQVEEALTTLRGKAALVQRRSASYVEQQGIRRYPPLAP